MLKCSVTVSYVEKSCIVSKLTTNINNNIYLKFANTSQAIGDIRPSVAAKPLRVLN